MSTLGDEFPKQQERLRELILEYRELPGGVGNFGAMAITDVLKRADRAAISGDVIEMLRSFEEMKECQ